MIKTVFKDSPYLKPCPFCGHVPESGQYGFDLFIVRCPECNCVQQISSSEEKAVQAWNKRFSPGNWVYKDTDHD